MPARPRPLPPIPEPPGLPADYRAAVDVLVLVASSFHELTVALLADPEIRARPIVADVLARHGDDLDDWGAVVVAWRDHLGITVEELMDSFDD